MARQPARGPLDRAVEKLGNIAFDSATSHPEPAAEEASALEEPLADVLLEVEVDGQIGDAQDEEKQRMIDKALDLGLIEPAEGTPYRRTLLGKYLTPEPAQAEDEHGEAAQAEESP